MRVNAPRRGVISKKYEKRRLGAFTTIPGRFLKNISGLLTPRGGTNKQEKRHTPQKRGGKQKIEKEVHTSQTHTATGRKQQVLIMSQLSSTEKAPSTDKAPITDKSTAVFGSLSAAEFDCFPILAQ